MLSFEHVILLYYLKCLLPIREGDFFFFPYHCKRVLCQPLGPDHLFFNKYIERKGEG